MPLWDWQFIVVTLIAAGAFGVIVRRMIPARRKEASGAPQASPACSHCASNTSSSSKARTQPSRVPTVPVVALRDLRDTARRH